MKPKVDAYTRRSEKWPDETTDLRPILLGSGLTKEIKWGTPCYSHDGRSIVILQEMKEFLALTYSKGALLNDPGGALEEQGPHSRFARRIRFTSREDVARLTDTVKAPIDGAIEVEEAGLELGAAPGLVLVDELQSRLEQDPAFRATFASPTPGRHGSRTRTSQVPSKRRPAGHESRGTPKASWMARASATDEPIDESRAEIASFERSTRARWI